jgi:predicted nucleic acid-binding protein
MMTWSSHAPLRARADYIVTRDKDLLSLGGQRGIRIVTPRQFLDLLERPDAG